MLRRQRWFSQSAVTGFADGEFSSSRLQIGRAPGIFDDRGEVWGIPWYNQETGVRAVAGKIVVLSTAVGSGGGLWPNRSRIAIFDPVTKAMTEAPTPPRHVWGNSWVALPDSGEILFGDNAAGIDSGMATGELFAIKVGATVKARRR